MHKEVFIIAKRFAPINIIVHYPQTDFGRAELAKRVASVHADIVNQTINKLNCTSDQKLRLIDEIIETTSNKMNEAGAQS